ncbi:hypothetical protein AGOR_G00088830 [Albula goreensis]|uniref:Ig-like domain-containing protein n=1 Tax=Albula goreensis TaxID=1534307 RepID=A0A8T3DPT5_9TELE|nr:hypothetical protein AGOR_G00088830 [Albula goreensis]
MTKPHMSHRDTQRHRGVLEGMDRNSVVLLHLLLITVQLYTAALDTVSVYHNVGEDAILHCANVVYPNCSSTTWIYDKHGSATELVTHGKVREAQRAERLSVGSNCSLRISAVHPEDAGLYTCQQYLYKGARQHRGAAPVRLSVLNTIPSTSSSTASPPTSTLTAGITAGIVLGCVILCLAVAVVVIYMRRGTGDRPTANQDPGQSADHVTYSEINHSTQTTKLKEKDNDTAEEFTEYATIKTAH